MVGILGSLNTRPDIWVMNQRMIFSPYTPAKDTEQDTVEVGISPELNFICNTTLKSKARVTIPRKLRSGTQSSTRNSSRNSVSHLEKERRIKTQTIDTTETSDLKVSINVLYTSSQIIVFQRKSILCY